MSEGFGNMVILEMPLCFITSLLCHYSTKYLHYLHTRRVGAMFGSVLPCTIATLDRGHFGERPIEGRNVLSHSLGLNQDLGTFFVVNISLRRCQHSLSHPDA